MLSSGPTPHGPVSTLLLHDVALELSIEILCGNGLAGATATASPTAASAASTPPAPSAAPRRRCASAVAGAPLLGDLLPLWRGSALWRVGAPRGGTHAATLPLSSVGLPNLPPLLSAAAAEAGEAIVEGNRAATGACERPGEHGTLSARKRRGRTSALRHRRSPLHTTERVPH